MSEPVTKAVTRRGRPRVAQPRVALMTWLPEPLANKVFGIARRNGRSTSEVLKRCVILQLDRSDEDESK